MFQAHIRWNKIENNAVKMHLYEMFKIDVLGTSQGRHPTGVFLGRFENIHSNGYLLSISRNTFGDRIENNTTVMCFVLCLKLTPSGRPTDITM